MNNIEELLSVMTVLLVVTIILLYIKTKKHKRKDCFNCEYITFIGSDTETICKFKIPKYRYQFGKYCPKFKHIKRR